MKLETQKKCLGALVALILVVGIFSAKYIGDLVTKYQSHKLSQSITELARPIHDSIESLQNERLLITTYLTDRTSENYKALSLQYPDTDKNLAEFARQLKATQMLLLAIPESELEETRKTIKDHRNSLNKKSFNFKTSRDFYIYVIGSFLNFLDKMYAFTDDPDYLPVVKSLMAIEFYREAVSQELNVATHELSHSEIKPGQMPLLRQLITDQENVYNNALNAQDNEIKHAIDNIENAQEKSLLTDLRKQFDVENPDLNGSIERAREYSTRGQNYLRRYSDLNKEIFNRLDKQAWEGIAELKEEMIKAGILALIIIIVLIGFFIFIQKSAAED